ncbi:MAG: division/cell wall cluster transcriptional repressor MraZ [Acutalibacteraceae bacterium]
MFTGTYQHNLDTKNRIIMPAKFRDELGDTFFVAKGLNSVKMGKGCLQVMSKTQWEEFLAKISALPEGKSQGLYRYFCAGADEVTPNAQGRFLIQDYLKKFAGIEKDAVIIGAGTRVEIWSSENWEEYTNAQTQDENILSLFDCI